MNIWNKLNKTAETNHGEFGFATLDADEMSQYIDIKKADNIARTMGKPGFAALPERDMENVVKDNPQIVRRSRLVESHESLEKSIISILSGSNDEVLNEDVSWAKKNSRDIKKIWDLHTELINRLDSALESSDSDYTGSSKDLASITNGVKTIVEKIK